MEVNHEDLCSNLCTGKYSASITKSTTHLICDDPDSGTSKLEKAKAQGIKLVGEDFLDKFA